MSLALARITPQPETDDDDQSDGELLAALVRQGDTAREARVRAGVVLDIAGGSWGLPRLVRTDLARAGLSEESIGRLRAAIALGARVAAARAPGRPMDASGVAGLLLPLLRHLPHEEMHVVLVDAQGRYLCRRRVASGGIATCSAYARDILAPVVEVRAAGFYLVHNHPSGLSQPSLDDISMTVRVLAGAEAVGVRLHDHLVVADDGYTSALPRRLP